MQLGYLLRNLSARARLLRVEWVARSDSSNSKGSGKNTVLSGAMYGENISGWSGRHIAISLSESKWNMRTRLGVRGCALTQTVFKGVVKTDARSQLKWHDLEIKSPVVKNNRNEGADATASA